MDKSPLRTMEEIIDYLRDKLAYKSQKTRASYIRPSSQRVHALRGRDEESDDDEDEDDDDGDGDEDEDEDEDENSDEDGDGDDDDCAWL